MNKKFIAIVLILISAILFGSYKVFINGGKGISGLKVFSEPPSSIFLNDRLVGKTPFDDTYPSGTYMLKMIPDGLDSQSASWQSQIVLVPNLLTFVRRELGTSELVSAGEIISLEKIGTNDVQISVNSLPDAAVVQLDGQEKGTTPLNLKDVISGDHDIAVSATGFSGRTVRIQAISGYKVNVNMQLALVKGEDVTSATSSSITNESNSSSSKKDGIKQNSGQVVKIKDTPTGFLRVRDNPSTSGKEIGQIKPGETYTVTEEKNGWFKIIFNNESEAWISSRYAEKIQ